MFLVIGGWRQGLEGREEEWSRQGQREGSEQARATAAGWIKGLCWPLCQKKSAERSGGPKAHAESPGDR